jgi:diguanylate cyclase (GGDEF)-like protein/PAS domain S-box-containing protein
MTHFSASKHSFFNISRFLLVLALILVGSITLYALSQSNYLLFHTIIEFCAIGVAISVFTIGWNTRHIASSDSLFLLGVAYGSVAVLDLLHTLAYSGMGVFPFRGADLPSQLWIASRYVESLSLLAAALIVARRKKLPAGPVVAVFATVTAALLLLIFPLRAFPTMYAAGEGLTRIKIVSEYFICGALALAIPLFWRQRARFSGHNLLFLLTALTATIASELFFTLYSDVYGFFNFLGHLLKLASFVCIYQALVSGLLKQPYEGLFRELAQSRDILRERESQLSAAEEELRTILDTAHSGIILVDEHGIIQFANEHAAELFRQDAEELQGSAYRDHVSATKSKEAEEQMFRLINKEIDQVHAERLYARSDGTTFWGDLAGTRMHYPDGGFRGLVGIITDITERKLAEQQLQAAHDKLDKLIELNADGIMVIDQEGVILFCNPAAAQMLGQSENELLGSQFNYPLNASESSEIEFPRGKGQSRVTELRTRETEWDGTPALLASFRDITDRKLAERELRESEEELEAIYENAPLIMMLVDMERKVRKANAYTSHFNGEATERMQGRQIGEALSCQNHLEDPHGCGFSQPCGLCTLLNLVQDTFETGKPHRQVEASLSLIRRGQERQLTFFVSTTLLRHMDEPLVLITIMDITERKEAERELQYMSFHDSLTGLYNRNFFETEMARLQDGRARPVGIITCDLDGLKAVNDTQGHQAGDEMIINTAEIIRNNFRFSDIIARIGGDEFAILLPETDLKTTNDLSLRLRKSVEEYNNSNPRIPLALSIGIAVSDRSHIDMQALFREADDQMYREKMFSENSGRSDAVQALTRALEARGFISDGHSERIKQLIILLARSEEMSGEEINDLQLLAQFHDLGKAALPDHILFKPGALNKEEAILMREHTKIGNRIARSIPGLGHIAEWIEAYHERWDGMGYPLGLRGEEIPLPCRILAIADAYDAMVSARPYSRALSHEEALRELRKNAGTQFDPRLVERFTEMLQQSRATECARNSMRRGIGSA